jgi:hypothetical protein
LFSQTQYRGAQFDMVRAPHFHSLGASCRTQRQTWDESKRHATVMRA